MKILALLLVFILLSSSYSFTISQWKLFKFMYNKRYLDNTSIDQARYKVWLRNVAFIKKHNEEADRKKHSFRVSMNKYGDLVRLKTFIYSSRL